MPRQQRAVIDTNILIFDTFEDAEHHAEASSLLDSLMEWIIPSLVIHEYVWALRGLGLSFREAREKTLEYLLDAKTTLVRVELEDMLYSLRRSTNFQDYNDLVILSTAQRTVKVLATYDQELRRRALSVGMQVLP